MFAPELARAPRWATVSSLVRRRRCAHRVHGVLAAAAALAVAPLSLADVFTFNATDNGTIQPGGPRAAPNGKNFLNIEADGNGSNASFGVIDFGQINVGNNVVNSINSISVDLFDAPSAFSSTSNVVLDFYLTTNTTASIQSGSSLKYLAGQTPQGGFATSLGGVFLGTGSYASTGSNGVNFHYNLSTANLTGTNNSYVLSQLNNFGTVRLVATLEAASGTGAAATYAGFSNNATPINPAFATTAPKLNFDLNVTALPNNDSSLQLKNLSDTQTVTVDLGRVIRNTNSGPTSVVIFNPGTSSANALLQNSNTFSSVTAGSLPLVGKGTTTVSVGLSAAGVSGAAGTQGSGTLTIQDVSNSNAANLTVNLTGSIIESRLLRNVELNTATNVNNVGRILVGTTVTNLVTVNTQNNVGDFSTNTLTHTFISATATTTFTSTAAANPYTISGTNVGGAVDWNGNGQQTATFKLAITPNKSFKSGAGTASAFLRLTGTNGLGGENLTGENDQLNLYTEFQAIAPAVLTGATNLTSATAGTFKLSNAGNDNGTNSVRLGGRLTSTSLVAQGGFSFTGTANLATGVVIPINTTNTVSYNFDQTGKLNGQYKGTYTYSAENDDQTVIGTHAGDVATNKTVSFLAVVTGNSGSGTANLLPGGSYAGYSINRGSGANTAVAFLAGTASGAGANPTVNFSTSTSANAAGDVGTISGTGTDLFVVQYSYSSNIAGNAISLGRFTGSNYAAAAFGNSNGNVNTNTGLGTEIVGAYNGTATLGNYGIDTTNHVVWAVVDRPGAFTPYTRAAGDANFDGKVDFTDIQQILSANKYNQNVAASFAEGDFNGDGKVNFSDIQALLAANVYNHGAYDQTVAAAPVASKATASRLAPTPKLSDGGSNDPAASGIVANSTTGGAIGDNKPTVVYDASTGDIKLVFDGVHANSIDIKSAGSFFTHPPTASNHPAPNDPNNVDSSFSTRAAGEVAYGLIGTSVWMTDWDYGNLMDPSHTLTQLLSDLTITYTVDGQTGTQQADVLVVSGVPEPTTLSLMALAGAGLLARRRRTRRT